MSRKQNLTNELRMEERCEMRLILDSEVYWVNAPMNDIRERGHHYKSVSPVERVATRMQLLQSIRAWIASSDRGLDRDSELTNFAIDVVLLWHLGDERVQLTGEPYLLPYVDSDAPNMYMVRCQHESNAGEQST